MTIAEPQINYEYETVPTDPIGVKIYTLANGMKIFMSINKDEPRIQTNIAVRAGSKHDPCETTGLAHYLEHMLFKGTRNIGALDWEKEELLLAKISDLYEEHRFEKNEEKRKKIYAEIDRISNEAAKLVAANEYDKMVNAIGATGTNAYTWVEQTVYLNDIPTNELERWMQLESERFREVVLRLFHTELETVYEEYNISQDRDFRKVSSVMNKELYPSHPYGTQTTLGKGEHLKNPSHVKIQEYFRRNYVPNNMALILSGDFNPNEVINLAEKYFGDYIPKPLTEFKYEKQPEITNIVRKEVLGQEAEYLELAWRFDGAGSEDAIKIALLSGILYNGQAGLLDLNLVQKQKVLDAHSEALTMQDFSKFSLTGKPREGQSLKDVEKLLLAEIENVKKGDFPDWLINAVIKDMKLGEIRNNESNSARAYFMTAAFILGLKWEEYVYRFEKMSKLTKEDIIQFANERLKDNYVVVYKKSGDGAKQAKVGKPMITPIELNRRDQSDFTKNFLAKKSPKIQPVFLDYKKEIFSQILDKGFQFDYIKNKTNPTFELHYILEMGKNHDRLFPLAVTYLTYLGTSKYTSEELQQEFFKLGLIFDVYSGSERVYVTLSGLDESFEEGLQLFEHILEKVQADKDAWDKVVDDIVLKRTNAMKDKNTILRFAMSNYAKYGKENPFTNIFSEQELRELNPDTLVDILQNITKYEHKVFYYGSQEKEEIITILDKYHRVPETFTALKKEHIYTPLNQTENVVYFVDFQMVQTEIMMLSKSADQFDTNEYIMSEWYNNYFGFGLSSIVFQEIRESKALAYSTYAYLSSPSKKNKPHYFQAYIGTQADKVPDAVPALRDIIENMPISEEQIEASREAILKKIETNRVTGNKIYWSYNTAKDRSLDHDIRRDIYEKMQSFTSYDLKKFQEENIKNKKYSFLVLGNKKNLDLSYLRSLGRIVELSIEEVFGVEEGE